MDAAQSSQGLHRRAINLALQGGGAHGAFTWGVLDRLLEEDRLVIEGISGSSGGAINGALLAHGMSIGGAPEARASLDRFWRRVSELGWLNPIRRGWLEKMQGTWNLDHSPVALMVEEMALLLSPGQTEAFSHNQSHLRELIEETIDIAALREQGAVKLFVGATHVRTGQPRIFYGDELTVDAFLASACVPQFYPTVVIDGEAYWDGGYLGNPPLWPLIYECKSRDIMIVQVHPIRRDEVPRNSAEITNRLNEIVFNAALMAQLRALSIVTQTMNQFAADGSQANVVRKKTFLIHLIEAEQAMKSLGMLSELNTDFDFLLYLKELGRTSANHWLHSHLHDVNHRSTFDIDALLIDTGSKSAPILTWPNA